MWIAETPAESLAGGLVVGDAAFPQGDLLRDVVHRSERSRTVPIASLGNLQVVESRRVDEERARCHRRGGRRQDDRNQLEVTGVAGYRRCVPDASRQVLQPVRDGRRRSRDPEEGNVGRLF